MERANILSLAAEYRELLAAHGARAVHIQDPDRILELPCDRQVLLDHAAWSCEHIPQVIDCLGGVQMCLRWIGCIQGVMAALGVMSIAETRKRMTEFAFQSEPIAERNARQ